MFRPCLRAGFCTRRATWDDAKNRDDLVITKDVQIRLAVMDEAEEIAQILVGAFGPLRGKYTTGAFAAVTPDADEIRDRFEEGPIWVALVEGKMVGTVSVLPEPDWLYIRSMAVLPETQGLGIGRKLLSVVEHYAVETGFSRLYLYTTYFLKGAIRLYESSGFTHDRDTLADEWHGVPGVGMDKKLGDRVKQNVARS